MLNGKELQGFGRDTHLPLLGEVRERQQLLRCCHIRSLTFMNIPLCYTYSYWGQHSLFYEEPESKLF